MICHLYELIFLSIFSPQSYYLLFNIQNKYTKFERRTFLIFAPFRDYQEITFNMAEQKTNQVHIKLSMDQLKRPSVEAFKKQAKLPVTLVLDNVRSMHNVGSAFRTADAFALEKILLCGITGTPPHREIEKTALGATRSMAWQHIAETEQAVKQLQDDGYRIVAVEQAAGSRALHRFSPIPTEKYALVFGNEVHGVSDGVMAMADSCIEIPQSGTKHSLNIAVSVGIVLWDFYTKLHLNT